MNSYPHIEQGDLYRHYKGEVYNVFGYATHTETEEQMVVYCNEAVNNQVWVRPASMFFDELPDGGFRFEKMEKIQEDSTGA